MAVRGVVLGGDIGGTKTLLQLAEVDEAGAMSCFREQWFDSQSYSDLSTIIREFIGEVKPDGACFGVAGPVKNGTSKITFLPWVIEAERIAQEFEIPQVRLVNDFQATAYGIEMLGEKDLLVLNAGNPEENGVRAVLGAGTFLGESTLVWVDGRYIALASEGGHADFAPRGILQAELYKELSSHTGGYVACGNLLSGNGLIAIYEFLRKYKHMQEPSSILAFKSRAEFAGAISEHALQHSDPLASAALDMFAEIYGAVAGNLALHSVSTGGVYIAGGIAPKISSKLADGSFMRAFVDKGAFSTMLMHIPVSVVLNPRVGLLGAMSCASQLLQA